MNKRLAHHRHLILFKSELFTVKSVYRKKEKDKIVIYLKFFENNNGIVIPISYKDINFYNFLRKGQTITVHLGNGGYCVIQDGDHRPENGEIYSITI